MDEAKLRETPKATTAFHEYCLLGRDRSLVKLAKKLGKPTAYTRCLEAWSAQYRWQERVKQYDEHVRAEEDRIIAEERDKILRSGFALMHERVKELDRLTRKLVVMTEDESKVWIPETRTFSAGEDKTSTVEKLEFNAPLFVLIDKYMASIAAEMGERVRKKEIAIKELPANVYLNFNPDQDGADT